MKFGLENAVIQKICAVLSRYPQVERAVLYGSRAKGTFKPGSDIDLALVGGESLTLDVLLKIMAELDELLLHYSIDVSILKDIEDHDVIDHINRVGVAFYERPDAAGNENLIRPERSSLRNATKIYRGAAL